MCTTWIIESSSAYSSFEKSVIVEEMNEIGSVDVEELRPIEALEKIDNGEHPDIVILDIVLAGIASKNIMDKLKQKSPESKCIVIASDKCTRAVQYNVPIIEKPFLPSLFASTFKRVYRSIYG